MINYLEVFNHYLDSRAAFLVDRSERPAGKCGSDPRRQQMAAGRSPGPWESALLFLPDLELPGHHTVSPKRKAAGSSFP